MALELSLSFAAIDRVGDGRQISIAASQPKILRLPWELLCDQSGTYLVHEQPRIAIRRQLAGAGGGRKPVEVKPKAQLRLLIVVSRPDGAGFIDPRAEAQAVLQAIDQTIYTELCDVLTGLGEYDRAQQACKNSLEIDKELDNRRGSTVAEAQLGTLAML